MTDRLKSKVALITGAGSGIGRAMALCFAGEGARIVAGDLNVQGSAETVRLIEEQGGTAIAVPLNVTVALELARSKIRVNAIAPAFTNTPMVDAMLSTHRDPEGARQKLGNLIPLGRLGTPEEIANAALFLASDESSFTTGAVLVLDGGLTVQ